MFDGYEALYRRYDALMYDVPYEKWAAYIAGLLPGGEKKLIEYACGTGGITLPLAKMDYDITAVDISEDMLDIAQEKLRKGGRSVRFVCADMAGLKLNKPVDAAICACDGVNYILDGAALLAFFSNVAHNLTTGGTFLFDISSRYKLRDVIGNRLMYDDGDAQTLLWQNSYNADENTLEMDITLFIANGEVYERYDERQVQRAWTRQEIEQALTKAGFEGIHCYAFPGKDEPKGDTQRLQFVAMKGNR